MRFDNESERNVVSLDIGYTEVDAQGQKGDGTLIRADWTRTLSPLTELQLSAGTQYSNQGDIFRMFQNMTQNLDQTSSVLPFGTPFRNNYANAGLNYESERTTAELRALMSAERYELVGTNTLDRDFYSFEFDINRAMSRKFFIGATLYYRSIDYKFQNRSDKDTLGALQVGFRFSPAFNLAIEYQRLDRSSNVQSAESTENRAWLRFGYVPNWGR